MTLSDLYPRFQGHNIIQCQITRKWYKIELYLQRPTNRKSHNGLSNGAIFSDLERHLTCFSRSRYYSLTLNISQTATDTATVTIEGKQETAPNLSNGKVSMTLSDL